jgi:hypothetical protein
MVYIYINIFLLIILFYYTDEYTREKTKKTKTKKRAKKRPQSANAAGSESVRLNIYRFDICIFIEFLATKSCVIKIT